MTDLTDGIATERTSARDVLNAETSVIHQDLHGLDVFQRLQNGTLTLQEYTSLMQAFFTFYRALDPMIECVCSKVASASNDYRYEPRSTLLAVDLKFLGKETTIETGDAYERISLPAIDTPAQLAGVIYVIDGSALGGIMLNRALNGLFETASTSGRQYWTWCERDGARQWRSALKFINSRWCKESERQIIVSHAVATFAALREWLLHSNTVVQA